MIKKKMQQKLLTVIGKSSSKIWFLKNQRKPKRLQRTKLPKMEHQKMKNYQLLRNKLSPLKEIKLMIHKSSKWAYRASWTLSIQ